MKTTTLRLALLSALGAGLATPVFALDLYVDTKTQQIFAQPGEGRVKLGAFERVEEKTQEIAREVDKEKAEIADMRQDLELKANELKAIEEHLHAAREDKIKTDEKWFNKINLRGYSQLRYNQMLSGDRIAGDPELRNVHDRSVGNNQGFFFRRIRLIFSGDINDYISMYIQPDLATETGGSQGFAQLRDAYFDLHFDKAHEYRIRAGQSKIPFGWENLQSSSNRIALDRADAMNSAVPSERDIGLMAYWTPEHVQSLWKSLSKKGLKTSGDYGVLGAGVYNGSQINRGENNDNLYLVAHTAYPFKLNWLGMPEQVLEVGVDAISGRQNLTPTQRSPIDNSEDRINVHAVLFQQPFGVQTEWNWGMSPTLNTATNRIERESLNGGYVQAMYKVDEVFGTKGVMTPYVKWQTYDGAWKATANAPRVQVDEVEAGVEYQINKALELTVAYSAMSRTNVASLTSPDFLKQASGDLIRTQLQINY
ncbi:MAG: porin [Methylomonas sp.]|nr:MAG: porin [Methylomonas sp.]PPD27661.1 MAG: porin [Methylomonas sp.]PPD38217.1 MAG: porin [Methylomonas sp.]PPD39647.1 MAG: porin [Methylomonas sp.]PPD51679.1 MAG: porin [Methylomonas sp.]